MIKILIGTKNPGKIQGAKEAFEKYLQNGAPLAYKKQQVEVAPGVFIEINDMGGKNGY